MNNPEKMVKAPWYLTGQGYILLYRMKKKWVIDAKQEPAQLAVSFAGGFGSMMVVDYKTSDVGPYGELLFIPGQFRYRNKKRHTISKIYVSTNASVVNGIENWAIPKQTAEFQFQQDGRIESVTISKDDNPIASLRITPKGIKFPLHTGLLPFPLVQFRDGKAFYTTFTGTGWGELCKLEHIQINPELFPDVSHIKPIAVIKVSPFHITFPVAQIEMI